MNRTSFRWWAIGIVLLGTCGIIGGLLRGAEAPPAPTEPEKNPAPRYPDPPGAKRLHPQYDVWLDPKAKEVILMGQVVLREGPLELFACLANSKEHESIVAVETKAYIVHAALMVLKAEPGTPVRFDPEFQPPTGTEIEIFVEWTDAQGKKHRQPARNWIQDVETKKPMAHRFVFAGSGFYEDEKTGKRYYLAEEGDLICVSNFATAMIDVAARSSQANAALQFQAFTENIPPVKTPVKIVLKPKFDAPPAPDRWPGSNKQQPEKLQSRTTNQPDDAVAFRAEAPSAAPRRKAFGLEKRVPWTTSQVKGSPEPPDPYRLARVFPTLNFAEPLDLTPAAGFNRLFVTQRDGKIFSFPVEPDVPRADLLLDVGHTTYGFAVHPKFAENGYVYVVYVIDPQRTQPDGTRLVRYQTRPNQRWAADPASETLILTWPSGGHNGGCLKFGPDGYLYVSTGDGSGIADELQTGQDLGDLLGSILRIDVDRTEPGRNYAIPKDNPFVNTPGARPEVHAYGIRQAWKMNFDPQTGTLWAGEIGQDLWEMIYIIQKGGNYGWSVREGSHPFRPERKRGPTPILDPIVEHPHTAFRSITGGLVYGGKRHPELRGAYIYGDFDTGRVWMLRYDARQKKVTEHRQLADSPRRIICFAEDDRRELYLLDFMGGMYQLEAVPPTTDRPVFPTRLSQTGLFASTAEHLPAPGVIPYSVNAPLWSDGADKERFLALPGMSQIEFDATTYPQPAPGARPGWKFPDGTVLVKTFSLELVPGDPTSRRRLETRIFHVERVEGTEEYGDQYWRGYTYIWNDEQTDAMLAPAEGLDRQYEIADPAAPGGKRVQTWHFPSRAECTLCHTVSAKYALGVNTHQMNRDHNYGGVIANQLATLEHIGVFTAPLPQRPENLPKLANYEDPSENLDRRARAYLEANCAHCHRKWGGGNADFQLLFTLPLEETGTLGVRPQHGNFGLDDPRLLVPGDPDRSMIFHRMQKLGQGRMPHVASLVVDQEAVKLIREWIRHLPAESGE